MTDNKSRDMKKIQAGLALLILMVVIVGVAVASSTRPHSMRAAAMPVTTTSSSNTATTTSSSSFKDGTYSATGSYDSPGGVESVEVSLKLGSGKVTAATVKSEANDPTAASYQSSFISGYKQFVIGKNITAIKLSNVSGSSLTSQGFNSALNKIVHEAQA